MCGIAGSLSLDGSPPDSRGVRAMAAALAHRGPDGEGFLEDGPVCLGHRRLAILDLTDAGRQPMVDRSGRYAITYNGEIYNYLELRKELEAGGVAFRSRSDTEVLLEGYVRWGPAVLGRLNGMFAFALWDREERILFAARDRFGEKPLYFRHEPGREFRFASELKALVPPGSGTGKVNGTVLFSFLAHGRAGTTGPTFLEGIDQIPPAHALTLRDGRLSLERYWALPGEPAAPGDSEEALAERVALLIEDAVRLRLRSDVPVGTSLSGGLDSSTVVCQVERILREGGKGSRQASFSAVFPGASLDESRWVDVVAGAAAIESHRVVPSGEEFLEDFPRLVVTQDEPVGGPSIYAQWKVMELARKNGVVVLLDGQGADEVFAGYHFFFADQWWRLLASGRWGTLRSEMRAYEAVHGRGRARTLLSGAVRGRVPRTVRALRGGPSLPWIDRDFVRRAGADSPPRPGDLRASLRECQSSRMLPHLLRHADRNSMAFSRETRLPFLDHRLVELVDSLPDSMKLRGGTTKWILREAIRGLVPESIRTRADKIGFAVPTRDWLRGPCADHLRDVLGSRRFRERGIHEAASVLGLLEAFLSGDDGAMDVVWNAFAVEHWMRAFVDGGGGAA